MDHMVFWVKNPGPRAPGNQNKDQTIGGGIPGPGAQGFQDNGVRKTRHTLTNWLAVKGPWVKIVSV